MADRPILMSAPMVRAILAGTKTQTRRIVQGAPDDWAPIGPEWFAPTVIDRHGDEQPGAEVFGAGSADGDNWIRCPYGAPGGLLWVRETHLDLGACYLYRADASAEHERALAAPGQRWRPAIHMPRAASRITLQVTGVRVQRLQDISRGDAMAEGCPFANMAAGPDPRVWYEDLWCDLHGADSWRANPWVWVVEFRREARRG